MRGAGTNSEETVCVVRSVINYGLESLTRKYADINRFIIYSNLFDIRAIVIIKTLMKYIALFEEMRIKSKYS